MPAFMAAAAAREREGEWEVGEGVELRMASWAWVMLRACNGDAEPEVGREGGRELRSGIAD